MYVFLSQIKNIMSENLLLKYLSLRTDETSSKDKGAVITISREYGCEGYELAELINDAINKKNKHKEHHPKWKILCKEIIEEAAAELNSKPEKLLHILNSEVRGVIEDMITSYTDKNYYSDNRIKQKMHEVIRRYAEEGHVIILGRAGCVIAKDIAKSLHIRIIAPFEWRVKHIAEKHKLSLSAAKARVTEIDNHRSNFIRVYKCDITESKNFDIIYNRSIFSNEEIAVSVMNILEERKLI
jgi:cytidylate kinase